MGRRLPAIRVRPWYNDNLQTRDSAKYRGELALGYKKCSIRPALLTSTSEQVPTPGRSPVSQICLTESAITTAPWRAAQSQPGDRQEDESAPDAFRSDR